MSVPKADVKKTEVLETLKLIRMPAPEARAVIERVASQEVGKAGDGFDRTDARRQFNKVATKSVGAGAVSRSLVARSTIKKESKPVSKAQAVVRVYDAADPKDKPEILAAALRAGLSKDVLKGFSSSEVNNTVKS
jgi:hypothetical protein